MSEVEGQVQGHRDGHGFVRPRRRPGRHLPVAAGDARGAAPRPRARCASCATTARAGPKAACSRSSSARKAPIIGRLLHESGIWLVAPEDKRYGQDILIPKNATANAAAGQVVAIELTEPPSMYSQPVGRVIEVLGEIDDPGMEIEIAVRKYEVPHRFSPETLAQAAALPDKVRAGRPQAPHRPDRRAAGHHRRRGRARLRRRGVLRAVHASAAARARSTAGA